MKSIVIPVALVLATVAPLVRADDMRDRVEAAIRDKMGGGGQKLFGEDLKPRDFDAMKVDDDKLRFRSVVRGADGTGNAVEFHFDLNGVPRWKLRTMSRSTDTKSMSAFRTGFLRLVEYNSTVAPRDSTNFLSFPSNQVKWTSLKDGLAETVTADGAHVKTVTTSLLIPVNQAKMGGLNFTIQSKFTDAATIANGTALMPTGLKYSIYIANFPYKVQNSRLALYQAFWQKDRSIERGSGSEQTVVSLGAGTGQFGWDAKITADGVASNVTLLGDLQDDPLSTAAVTDGDDTDNEVGDAPKVIVYTFPRAAKIEWDPYMQATDSGLSSSAAVTARGTAPIMSLMIAALVAFVV